MEDRLSATSWDRGRPDRRISCDTRIGQDHMTPEAWFDATDPNLLLREVDPPPMYVDGAWRKTVPLSPQTKRRLQLFAIACARMVWDLLPTDARSTLVIAERYAERRATAADLVAATIAEVHTPLTAHHYAVNAVGLAAVLGRYRYIAGTDYYHDNSNFDAPGAARAAAMALACVAAGPAPRHRPTPETWHTAFNTTFTRTRLTQAHYLRDIVPPPGYCGQLEARWLTGTVLALAQQMDSIGDFSAVPIFADALQDAGCDDERALQCCRVVGNVHVRGNWVVDLALGKL